MHLAMMAKRFKKLELLSETADKYVERWGSKTAADLVVAWGSARGPALEAVRRMVARDDDIAIAVPKMLFPLPRGEFLKAVSSARRVFVVEVNYTGQLAGLLRREVQRPIISLSKADGQIFTASEVISRIEQVME
jgi:2-oxoglutarate ferredoxin oxidoreductase subunit alpha